MLCKPIRSRLARRALGTTLAAALVAPIALALPASADITVGPATTTVSFGTQTNVAPNGPITGLQNASVLNINVTTPSGGNLGFDARLCRSSTAATVQSTAGFNPTQTGNCISAPITAGTDDFVHVNQDATNTTAAGTFTVGLGKNTVTFGGTNTRVITCDAANPCQLVLKENVTAGVNWIHYDLNYLLGTPQAPTAVAGNAGDASATVTWTGPTYPTNTGNADIDQYVVTLSPGGATQTVTPPTAGAPVPTTASFSGLTNGTPYTATVTARNAGGNTSSASTASAPFTPTLSLPGAPGTPAATAGAGRATVTWAAPAGTSPAVTGYEVTAIPAIGTSIVRDLTPSTATTYDFTGLTNGTAYTFRVRANSANGFGPLSAASNSVTPSGITLTQTVTVRRPQGALVLTQVCGRFGPGTGVANAGTTGTAPTYTGTVNGVDGTLPGALDGLFGQYPYPTDATTGDAIANYPTNCAVAMGNATRITTGANAGKFLQATAPLNQITVVNTNDGDTGWDVTGTMGDLGQTPAVSGPNGTIKGSQLGWAPSLTGFVAPATNGDGSPYTGAPAAGTTVPASTTPGTGGLGAGAPLASAPAGQSMVTAVYDAQLTMLVPVKTKSGNYSGTLTISATLR